MSTDQPITADRPAILICFYPTGTEVVTVHEQSRAFHYYMKTRGNVICILSPQEYAMFISGYIQNGKDIRDCSDKLKELHVQASQLGWTTVTCPFCNAMGLDLCSLKGHLMSGDCELFNDCEIPRRVKQGG